MAVDAEVDRAAVVTPSTPTLSKLPAGVRLLGTRSVDSYLVDRFALARPWHLSPSAIGTKAEKLVGPAPPGPAVLIDQPSA